MKLNWFICKAYLTGPICFLCRYNYKLWSSKFFFSSLLFHIWYIRIWGFSFSRTFINLNANLFNVLVLSKNYNSLNKTEMIHFVNKWWFAEVLNSKNCSIAFQTINELKKSHEDFFHCPFWLRCRIFIEIVYDNMSCSWTAWYQTPINSWGSLAHILPGITLVNI